MSGPISDLDELIAAFGAETLAEVEWKIEEAASDVTDGRIVTIQDAGDEAFTVVVDVLGTEIEFPTTVAEVVQTANDLELAMQDHERSFRIIPGDPDSRVLLHVPHSSRTVPDDVRADIVLDEQALERELDAMTDAYTDVIAERVAESSQLRPWIFVNRVSRLVVDPERFPDESEEMNAVGMGVVYTRTSTGAPLRDEDSYDEDGLVGDYFEPYAAAFAALVEERLSAVGSVTIVDLHSYPLEPLPYELHADGPRPQVCLGTDDFHTSPELLEAARDSFAGFELGTNSPFSGCYVPLAHYGTNDVVGAVMVELRRDLYMDDDFGLVEPALAPIVEALADLLDQMMVVPSAGLIATQEHT